MSHYHTMVLVNPEAKDVRAEVDRLLAPFDEDIQVDPYEVKVEPGSLEMMVRFYKTQDLESLAEKMQDWSGKKGFVRDNTLYYLSTYSPNSRWDWYRIGGRWDGVLYSQERRSRGGFNFGSQHESLEYNARPVAELPPVDKLQCYAVVTPDGKWHSQGRMGWWARSMDSIPEADWNAKVRRILDEYKSAVAVCVDCHI